MDTTAPITTFTGINGFLGTRASLMLDVVFVALFLVLPAMAWAIWTVRYRRNYALHKRLQLAISGALGVVLVAFEVDMQLVSGWRDRAALSPYWSDGVMASLYVHLVFSISTAALLLYVVVGALRNIPKPPGPSPYSARHMFWARLAAIDLLMTSITGWIFYWMAFGAR